MIQNCNTERKQNTIIGISGTFQSNQTDYPHVVDTFETIKSKKQNNINFSINLYQLNYNEDFGKLLYLTSWVKSNIVQKPANFISRLELYN